MPYIENDAIKIYYEDIGIGEPIIFLHGALSRGIISFSSQLFFFQATMEFRSILPDLRSHGRTISKSSQWETPHLADDIITLMDSLNIPKAHLVGHSLGGDVALYCAIKYTDRFLSLTSISSTGSINDEVLNENKNFTPENLEKEGKINFIEMIKKNHSDACRGDWKNFINQMSSNTEKYPDFSDMDLKKITIPTLFIIGENDPLIKENELLRLKKNVKNIRIEVLKGCGHYPHTVLEQPMKVNEILIGFFKDI
ncbi:alpha/beta fold hydrolase [Clostridium cellulovorans]|uniref:Alpha/beta hydrolase fold n=1 Tax=Clostridium cellulovorans (strain ATCC 35296 / DSM 3052 / OCM 3 / 743B) TaxID=573061 RepID=D9SV72_CLOC7|nr:alpha/beta hydrolase [Clostridium cellulovorans]ADL53046.1 alpha/beta hydrolase fold [Clostridium cellulovorans 743B]